jgi:predicted ATP-dependent serine protease
LRIPVRGYTAFLAHIGLLGELQPLPSLEARLLHVPRMGFSCIIVAGLSSFTNTKKNKKKIQNSYANDNEHKNLIWTSLNVKDYSKLWI